MDKRILPLLLASLLVAALTAAVTSTVFAPAPAQAEAPTAGGEAQIAGLRQAVERMEKSQAELARAVEELRLAPAQPGESRMAVGELERAVARYFEEHGLAGSTAAVDARADHEETAAESEAVGREAVSKAFARLLDPELDDDERQRIWSEIGAQGLSDELVAEFEARAEREPNDPDVRVDLAGAYLQKTFEAGSGPMAGHWAMKADATFDAALGLDENHWDARFYKAVSLSFWPPALGMQNKAIEQFEVLVEKQGQMPKDDEQAQTYLFLGNMYQQTGKPEKALATWQQGLALFPDNAELKDQVSLAQGN